jgi:hypothetical protein
MGTSTIETIEKVDATEKAIGELDALKQDVDRLKANAEVYIQEEELKEKDQAAEQVSDDDPEQVVAQCPDNICTLGGSPRIETYCGKASFGHIFS